MTKSIAEHAVQFCQEDDFGQGDDLFSTKLLRESINNFLRDIDVFGSVRSLAKERKRSKKDFQGLLHDVGLKMLPPLDAFCVDQDIQGNDDEERLSAVAFLASSFYQSLEGTEDSPTKEIKAEISAAKHHYPSSEEFSRFFHDAELVSSNYAEESDEPSDEEEEEVDYELLEAIQRQQAAIKREREKRQKFEEEEKAKRKAEKRLKKNQRRKEKKRMLKMMEQAKAQQVSQNNAKQMEGKEGKIEKTGKEKRNIEEEQVEEEEKVEGDQEGNQGSYDDDDDDDDEVENKGQGAEEVTEDEDEDEKEEEGDVIACPDPACSFLNKAHLSRCGMCYAGLAGQGGTQEEGEGERGQDGEGGIACPACTFLNSSDHAKCGVCETLLPQPQDVSCSHCTFLNKPDANFCEICRKPLHPTPQSPWRGGLRRSFKLD